MELALILRELSRRRLLLAIGVLVAAVAAILSAYQVSGFKLKPRALQYSSATTRVFVDNPSSVLGNLTQSFEPLEARATAYANFMASPTVLNLIGEKAGIPGDRLYAAGPVDPQVPRVVQEPTAVERNVEITGETAPYRLNFNADPNLPTIVIAAQAPTTEQSIRLADAAVSSLEQYVKNLQDADHIPAGSRVVIRQLGQANGGVVDGGVSKAIMLLVFIGVLLVWCMLGLVSSRFRANWRASATLYDDQDHDSDGTPDRPRRKPAVGKALNLEPERSKALNLGPERGVTQGEERVPEAPVAALRATARTSGR